MFAAYHLRHEEMESCVSIGEEMIKPAIDGVGKMAQQVRGLATKPDCLSSLLGTHEVEGGKWFMKMNMKEGRMWTCG